MPFPPDADVANTTGDTSSLVSLRTELLVGLGLLVAAALLVAVTSVVLFWGFIDERHGALWLLLLVAGDVVVFVALGAYQLKRAITGPLARAAAATSAIAAGDLTQRVPGAATRELATLSASINRMTDHLLAEQVRRIRAEKLAGIGRLAAGVAHEIGNPLGAIIGYSHLIRRRAAGDASTLEAIDGLERESARIDRIVRSLLDYGRPRRNTGGLVDLNDTIRSAVQILNDQGILRRIELSVTLDDQVATLRGERHELQQMLVNLLLNAADAMDRTGRIAVVTHALSREMLVSSVVRRESDPPRASVARRLAPRIEHWLETTRPSRILQLVVADSGPGISEDDAERIFDPFFTTKMPGQGTGLGLAIVARVVDDLHGTIWVERAREGGAAFHVLFPTATTSFSPVAPVAAQPWPAVAPGTRPVSR